jgi:hypothetical protein
VRWCLCVSVSVRAQACMHVCVCMRVYPCIALSLARSVSLALALSLSRSLSRALSLSLTRSRVHARALPLFLSLFVSLFLSVSLFIKIICYLCSIQAIISRRARTSYFSPPSVTYEYGNFSAPLSLASADAATLGCVCARALAGATDSTCLPYSAVSTHACTLVVQLSRW